MIKCLINYVEKKRTSFRFFTRYSLQWNYSDLFVTFIVWLDRCWDVLVAPNTTLREKVSWSLTTASCSTTFRCWTSNFRSNLSLSASCPTCSTRKWSWELSRMFETPSLGWDTLIFTSGNNLRFGLLWRKTDSLFLISSLSSNSMLTKNGLGAENRVWEKTGFCWGIPNCRANWRPCVKVSSCLFPLVSGAKMCDQALIKCL